MNINKFTQNSLQAVQNCEKIAMDYGNQELAQEHLLYALLTQDDSLIAKLMEKMGLDKNMVINRVEESLRKLPKVQGGQQYVGQALNNVLVHAEDEAKQMGDEYVSVEHLFLAMIKYAGKEMKSILRELGISRDGFLQALSKQSGYCRYPEQIWTGGARAENGTSDGRDLFGIRPYLKSRKQEQSGSEW